MRRLSAWRKVRSTARSSSAAWTPTAASFIAQRFHRIEPGRPPGRVDRRQEREAERHDDDERHLQRVDLGGELREEVDRRIEDVDARKALHELADRLDILSKREAEAEAG